MKKVITSFDASDDEMFYLEISVGYDLITEDLEMTTHAEDLSTELWISIFDYLSVENIYQSFSQLNLYFDDILASTNLSFKVELKPEENDNISDTILNRIIALKSFSYDYFPEFVQNYGLKLIRLQSLLIKANTKELPFICMVLQQINTLKYLSLSCIPNQNLLENILKSSSLRKCRLHFWRILTPPIHDHFDINSNIEILHIKLNDNKSHFILNLFLSHMPKLKQLEIIEENLINNNSHPLFNQNLSTNLEILKLTWGYHTIQSNSLQHLFSTMSNLKHLSLSITYYTLNEILNDNLIHRLWMILKQIKQIKISILCRRLTKTIENNVQIIFDKYCQQILQTIRFRSNARIEVRWFEKNVKIQKIEIYFTNV